MIRSIFFDFGGCLDAPGIHTRTLFWNAFMETGIVRDADRTDFQDAYTDADKKMMSTGIARDMNLRDFNRLNGTLIAQSFQVPKSLVTVASDAVTDKMSASLFDAKEVLTSLHGTIPMAIISNFTGNLKVILEEFGLHPFFHSITESYYAGVSKPDLKIFQLALATQSHPPGECLYIGDNPKNDIVPAKSLGIKTVLIHPPSQKQECGADAYIQDLRELPALIQRL